MNKRSLVKTTTVLGVATLSLFSSCGVKVQTESESIQQTEATSSLGTLAVDVNKYTSNKIICDPLAPPTVAQGSYEHGIKASLHYLEDNMPRMYKATDYVQFGRKSDKSVFLTDMNVPTRMFSEGFSTSAGQTLAKDNGEKLIEYFGLKMQTNLILTSEDEAGTYELAMLADDGSNLVIKSGDGGDADDRLISNDGDHPTRMGCSTHIVRLHHKAMLPVEVTYYQGPRYHISNVLMMRKASEAGKDPLCGQLGNNLYFNPDNQSKPEQAFKDLQARGWKVLKPGNFVLGSDSGEYNPCVEGTKPVISQFGTGEVGEFSAFLSWITDIPATTQVQLTNMSTGAVTTTTSDNNLRVTHEVTLSNLQPGVTYKAQAISVSGDLGRTISAEVTFTTN